jgi:hypothetical protein
MIHRRQALHCRRLRAARGDEDRLLVAGQERIAWSKMAAILVAARFCEPSSELHIAQD